MSRVFSIFLILSLIVIHGQINHALLSSTKTDVQVSTNAELVLQTNIGDKTASEISECCKDNNKNSPIKVSYCQLDCGLSLPGVEFSLPSSKQLNLRDPDVVLVSKEPASLLRPPIA